MATKSHGVRLMFKVQIIVHDLKWKDSAVASAGRTSKTPSLQLRVNIALFGNCQARIGGPVLCICSHTSCEHNYRLQTVTVGIIVG